jgi:hypothetical protein
MNASMQIKNNKTKLNGHTNNDNKDESYLNSRIDNVSSMMNSNNTSVDKSYFT